MSDRNRLERLTRHGALRVPEITAFFWAIKALSTAMGESTSDYLVAGIIAIPAVGYRRLDWNPIFSFSFAYAATRPLGASFADWMGKPQAVGGLGWGDGTVALALTGLIFILVAYLAITRRDVQGVQRVPAVADEAQVLIRRSPQSLD